MQWSRAAWVAGSAAGIILVGGAAALAIGQYIWRQETARVNAALAAQQSVRDATQTDSGSTRADVPAVVARYLALAIPDSSRSIVTARVRWTGEMRLRPDAEWARFTADQQFTVSPPGFAWDARVAMLPLVPVRVRDSYVAGRGEMLGRVGGLISVVNQAGTPELAAGALVRWLGEAVWFPSALVPGPRLTWHAVDDSTARAVLNDGANEVTAEFFFASTGEPVRMTAMRYRDVNGRGVLTPFEGRYERFTRRNGFMIPATAEVAWLLPEGRFAYWRGRLEEIAYDFAPQRRG